MAKSQQVKGKPVGPKVGRMPRGVGPVSRKLFDSIVQQFQKQLQTLREECERELQRTEVRGEARAREADFEGRMHSAALAAQREEAQRLRSENVTLRVSLAAANSRIETFEKRIRNVLLSLGESLDDDDPDTED